jgi:tetratricopeptide (TPR) repeat protein
MSEETERLGSGPEGHGAGVDPVAVSLALGGADREEANAFLRQQTLLSQNQNALIADQRHHLHEQLKQIHLDVWEKRLGVLLRVATAFIGVAVAAAMAWLVWNAASSNDLVIDPFAVPPDLAAQGLSGPVVAAKLSDKIAAMQAATVSSRPSKSYANGLPDGLKLEIPETGVSLSELDRFLREKLGHDLHIGGEMVRADQGVALTARVGSDGSATVTGPEADMDALLQKLAEQVYRITQPYRYGVWLRGQGRIEEAIAVYKTSALSGPDKERAWAYNGWGVSAFQLQSESLAVSLAQRSHALDPNFSAPVLSIAAAEHYFGRWQDSQRDYGVAQALEKAHGQDYLVQQAVSAAQHRDGAMVLMYQGALRAAAEQMRQTLAEGQGTTAISVPPAAALAEILAALHEPGAARAVLAEYPVAGPNSGSVGIYLNGTRHARLLIALEAHDWPEALTVNRTLPQVLARYPGLAECRVTYFDPLVAVALAHMGQFAAAEARLKPMPADCYPCLMARAQVAALQKQDARADFWFARATAVAPSLPYAESEWGHALLDRGKPDAAIETFVDANKKGPHFADPLEGWGEALMAKNQSHLALAKFAEAEKYAPNWARLHLKWGEALVYAGKPDEAKAQFSRAAQLDLTTSEKAELAKAGGNFESQH